MGEVKLHGFWYSPFTLRVVWTLKLKDIAYENIEEDRYNKSVKLLEYNPVYKKTPVLVHNGKPLCESMLIVEYIDQIWPHNSLLPADPYHRALARFWVNYTDDLVLLSFCTINFYFFILLVFLNLAIINTCIGSTFEGFCSCAILP